MDKTLKQIQLEVFKWSRYNFGGQPAHRPLLGVVEEIGELSHVFLKEEQGIRLASETEQQRFEKEKDSLGDIMIYLCDYAARRGIDLQEALNTTWDVVKQRDWKRFPKNGRTE